LSFFNNISKTIAQGVDRAKFEADKFTRTTRIQGELNDLKKEFDSKLQELGQRAYELFRAGQISAPTVASLAQALDQLRSGVVVKEEELRAAQAVTFEGAAPAHETTSAAQQVPISYEPPQPTGSAAPAADDTRVCATCGFQMPRRAMFCPSCGARQPA
jgi:hypothetical protein